MVLRMRECPNGPVYRYDWGCFDGHPWNAGGTWPFTVEDAPHPLCQSFDSRTFRFSDEIYQYKGYDREKSKSSGEP